MSLIWSDLQGSAVSEASYDILIVGQLLNNDVVMAEALTCRGFRCLVVRAAEAGAPDPDSFSSPLRYFSLDRVVVCENSHQVFSYCIRAKCIITYSGGLTSLLRYYWLWALLGKFPPIINLTTGSDITELALASNRAGFLYRSLLKRCAFTVISPYIHAIKALRSLKLERYMFMRYPHLLAERPISAAASSTRDEIVFLHVSNLDWGESDNKPGRNSTKGNDRFLRAFIDVARKGFPVRCKILDRGPDRFVARQMIERLGASHAFEWLPPVSSSSLSQLMSSADVVVDQFDVGGFGGIALEAMAIGKPVMIHLDSHCSSLIYAGSIPIINCSSDDQIREAILENLDRSKLRDLGQEAKKWVFANHGVEHNMEEFVLRLCIAAGVDRPESP